MVKTVGAGCAASGVPTDTQPRASFQPYTDIPRYPQVPQGGAGGCHAAWPWVFIWGSRHHQGGKTQVGGVQAAAGVVFNFRDAPGTGTPSLTARWRGAQPEERDKGERCHLQRFYYFWGLFLKPQLLAGCETPGSAWKYGCAVSGISFFTP